MSSYEDICKANATLSSVDVKGKDYVQVNERIKAFRMLHPNGSIKTMLLSDDSGRCIFTADVYDEDGRHLGTGHAYEKESSSLVNKTSYIENCETSAVGRALGMCGYGIDTAVASAEEVETAINNQNKAPKLTCEECGDEITSMRSMKPDVYAVKCKEKYGRLLCLDCIKKLNDTTGN